MAGAIGGFVGGAIGSSGIPFANTLGMIASSTISSVGSEKGMRTNLGFGSINWDKKEFNSIFTPGKNTALENFGYIMGAYNNIGDALMVYDEIKIAVEKKRYGEFYPWIKAAEQVDRFYKNGGNYFGRTIMGPLNPPSDPRQYKPRDAADKACVPHDISNQNLLTRGQSRELHAFFDRRTTGYDLALVKRLSAVAAGNAPGVYKQMEGRFPVTGKLGAWGTRTAAGWGMSTFILSSGLKIISAPLIYGAQCQY